MRKITMKAGSAEWIASRSASKAPAMMGCDPTTSRTELIHMMATGFGKEFSDWQQKYLLDKGNVSEIGARALAEEVVGEDFVPSSAETDDGYLTAAPDGATFGDSIGLEAKLWNETLAASVRAGDLPPAKYWQLEQQILVYGFDYVLFVVSDGTPEKFVSMEYRAVPGRADHLMAGWRQFDKDVEEYKRKLAAGEIEQPKESPKAETIKALPSVFVQATGMVNASNLSEFKEAATAFIAGIKTELVCDQDFADAESTVKFCKDAESNLESTKASVLAQMSTVDEVVRTLDHIAAQLRDKRLMLDKLVKSEKESRKLAIVTKAGNDFSAHVESLEAETKPIRLAVVRPDFAGAIKGMKKMSAMQEAVDTALRDGKFAADQSAKDVREKLAWCKESSAGYGFLFSDLSQLIANNGKEAFEAIVTGRIDKHKAEETAKAEEQRAAIQADEERKATAKAQAEAEAILAAERAKQAAEDAARAKVEAEANAIHRSNEQQDAYDAASAVMAKKPSPVPVLSDKAVSDTNAARHVRPTDKEIIAALAETFNVPPETVVDWLMNMSFAAVEQ